MKRAVLYTRISYDPSLERSGVERQEEDARSLATARGFDIVEVVEDNDTSAAGQKYRAGFERVLELINGGVVNVVVAWSFDRLTRNRRDQVRLIEAGQEHGITLALVRGSDIDMSTPAGRLTADILASVARNEIDVKSDRQKRANLQRAMKGQRPSGGRRAFGYTLDMETIPEEADAITQAYDWLLAGTPLAGIARRWNDLELTTPQLKRGTSTPNRWTGATVSRCLKKPLYAGLLTYRGEGYGEGNWSSLVTIEKWTDAQVLMNHPDRKPPHGKQKLLTGIARCGICDDGTRVHAGGGKTGLGVYACSGPVKHLTRRRDHIDAFVLAHVIERLSLPDARELFTPQEDTGARRRIIARLTEIGDKLDDLATLLATGVLTKRGVELASEQLRAEREELSSQLESTDPVLSVGLEVIDADDIEAAWDGLSTDVQRELIDRLMVVTIHRPVRGARSFDPETVTITFR